MSQMAALYSWKQLIPTTFQFKMTTIQLSDIKRKKSVGTRYVLVFVW